MNFSNDGWRDVAPAAAAADTIFPSYSVISTDKEQYKQVDQEMDGWIQDHPHTYSGGYTYGRIMVPYKERKPTNFTDENFPQ